MTKIVRSVGHGGVNLYNDVIIIQKLLNKQRLPGVTGELKYDGDAGKETITRIEIFQKNIVKMAKPDGRIDPGGKTMAKLTAGEKTSSNPGGLPESEYIAAARMLDCEVAAIKAVVETEVGVRGAFDSQQRPTILFERHIFSGKTGGKFDKTNPDLSNPVVGGYGRFVEQYPKLERAITLNKKAALESVSWGAFQIMGFNHRQAGHNSIEEFVDAMKKSVQKQIAAFIFFVKNDPALNRSLHRKDWTTFAKIYNGPAYAVN